MLLDAGEATWAQLVRCYGGHAAAAAQVAALAAVWISHRHADHMLGLPAVLVARPPHAPPLLVIGPPTPTPDWHDPTHIATTRPYLLVRLMGISAVNKHILPASSAVVVVRMTWKDK